MTKNILSTIISLSSVSAHETLVRVLAATLVGGSTRAHACGLSNRLAYETGRAWWSRQLAWSSDHVSPANLRSLAAAFAKECAQAHEAGQYNRPCPIDEAEASSLVEGILRPWSWEHFDHTEQLELHG